MSEYTFPNFPAVPIISGCSHCTGVHYGSSSWLWALSTFLLPKQSLGEDWHHVKLTALRRAGETKPRCSRDDSSAGILLPQRAELEGRKDKSWHARPGSLQACRPSGGWGPREESHPRAHPTRAPQPQQPGLPKPDSAASREALLLCLLPCTADVPPSL